MSKKQSILANEANSTEENVGQIDANASAENTNDVVKTQQAPSVKKVAQAKAVPLNLGVGEGALNHMLFPSTGTLFPSGTICFESVKLGYNNYGSPVKTLDKPVVISKADLLADYPDLTFNESDNRSILSGGLPLNYDATAQQYVYSSDSAEAPEYILGFAESSMAGSGSQPTFQIKQDTDNLYIDNYGNGKDKFVLASRGARLYMRSTAKVLEPADYVDLTANGGKGALGDSATQVTDARLSTDFQTATTNADPLLTGDYKTTKALGEVIDVDLPDSTYVSFALVQGIGWRIVDLGAAPTAPGSWMVTLPHPRKARYKIQWVSIA